MSAYLVAWMTYPDGGTGVVVSYIPLWISTYALSVMAPILGVLALLRSWDTRWGALHWMIKVEVVLSAVLGALVVNTVFVVAYAPLCSRLPH